MHTSWGEEILCRIMLQIHPTVCLSLFVVVVLVALVAVVIFVVDVYFSLFLSLLFSVVCLFVFCIALFLFLFVFVFFSFLSVLFVCFFSFLLLSKIKFGRLIGLFQNLYTPWGRFCYLKFTLPLCYKFLKASTGGVCNLNAVTQFQHIWPNVSDLACKQNQPNNFAEFSQ